MGKRTRPNQILAAERRARAVELRKLGLTYAKIGEQLGVARQTAYQLVQSALEELRAKTSEGLEELRQLELERLDEWQVLVVRELQKGRVLQAIDRLLKIAERRAKLLGLDAPTKHVAQVSGPEGGPVALTSDLDGLSDAELLELLHAPAN